MLLSILVTHQAVFDFGVAIKTLSTLLVDMGLVIIGNQLQSEGLLPILKETWLIVAAFAVAARDGCITARNVHVASQTIHVLVQYFCVVHLDRRAGKLWRLQRLACRCGKSFVNRNLLLRRCMAQ